MAIVPDIQKLSASSTSLGDLMQAMYDYFNNTSSRFNVVLDNGPQTAFTLEATSPDWDFQINLRNPDSSSNLYVLLDHTGSFTDSGNGTTAPSSNATIGTSEVAAIDSGSVGSSDFYVGELDDMIYGLFMDSNKTTVSDGFNVGRVYVPLLKNLGDGWAIFQGIHFNAFNDLGSRYLFRESTNNWKDAYRRNRNDNGWPGGGVVPNPVELRAAPNEDGNKSRAIGFTRYIVVTENDFGEGTVIKGPNSSSYVSISGSGSKFIIWDESINPEFAN